MHPGTALPGLWPGTVRKEETAVAGGGFAFAIQPHREVRPGSGLVGIVGNTYK